MFARGRYTPPTVERPANVFDRALQLRNDFKPYKVIDWYGRQMEIISYPVPNDASVSIMMRTPNDPTTIEEITLEKYL